MKFYLSLLFSCLINLNIFGQIKFEKGYFIDNTDQNIMCYIRNMDWENNPKNFQYKTPDGTLFKADVSNVKEFGIDSGATYVRVNAKIDHTLADKFFINSNRNPNWVQEEVFLKVLVKGDLSLLVYKQNFHRQFYYQRADSIVEPLVHKYYYNENGVVSANFGYRQQLWNNLKCKEINLEYVSNLKYHEEDLVRVVKKYNDCRSNDSTITPKTEKRDSFSFRITPGLNLNRYIFSGASANTSKNNTMLRLGMEAEYIAPFNNSKWGLLIEPVIQYYKLSTHQAFTPIKDVHYWCGEIPFGIRYYLFIGNNCKIFLNGLFVLNVFNRQFRDEAVNRKVHIKTGSDFAFGTGISKNKFSAELRYLLRRDIVAYFQYSVASFTQVSLVLGYKIFVK